MDTQQLSALEEIRQAKARYCRLIDHKQWDSLRAMFTQQVQLRFHGTDGALTHEFTERDAFIALTADMLQQAQTIHQVHNPEIELLPADTARVIWSMEDRIIFPDGVPGPFRSLHGYGHYEETLEKHSGDWLIRTMDLTRTILAIQNSHGN
ncbi:nuclear transport factor 2 family protein [Undibacterium sp. TJN25]|uniref:nuclear transport factor 2 family protein n=1 Tax=Undibacterium sp. TJN25 TaxID=3413056 RepID=UPI003BF1077A